MTAPQITRTGPGAYQTPDGRLIIVRNEQIAGAAKWVIYARDDRHLVSDPHLTLRDAVAQLPNYAAALDADPMTGEPMFGEVGYRSRPFFVGQAVLTRRDKRGTVVDVSRCRADEAGVVSVRFGGPSGPVYEIKTTALRSAKAVEQGIARSRVPRSWSR